MWVTCLEMGLLMCKTSWFIKVGVSVDVIAGPLS